MEVPAPRPCSPTSTPGPDWLPTGPLTEVRSEWPPSLKPEMPRGPPGLSLPEASGLAGPLNQMPIPMPSSEWPSSLRPETPRKRAEAAQVTILARDAKIVAFEASTGAALQELVVREAVSSFREAFPQSDAMQADALASTLASLPGRSPADSTRMPMVDKMFGHSSAIDDPVLAHFSSQLNSLEGVDLAQLTPNENGSLPERVAFANQQKEKEFQEIEVPNFNSQQIILNPPAEQPVWPIDIPDDVPEILHHLWRNAVRDLSDGQKELLK